jgi:class 3 adenylate cyclase
MEVDETGRSRASRPIDRAHRSAIVKNHGRIIKTTGDGMLVEFRSVADAVLCASRDPASDGATEQGRLAGALDPVPHWHQSRRRNR